MLGKGQAVTFFAPTDIAARILRSCGKNDRDRIEIKDVLRWTIHETWADLKRSAPLWAAQSERHRWQREILAKAAPHVLTVPQAKDLLEPEAKSVIERYGFQRSHDGRNIRSDSDRSKLQDFGLCGTENASLDEEQERELQPEIERQREIERPNPRKPVSHSVHHDLRTLIQTGHFKKELKAFMRAFSQFRTTSAGRLLPLTLDQERLWVTADFATAVEPTQSAQKVDDHLRPAHWVLRQKSDKQEWCILLSPFEVNELLPDIRASKFVALATYAPRTSTTSRPLERLAYCNIGGTAGAVDTRMSLVLSLFAGQLYVATFDDYIYLCRMLGLYHRGVQVSQSAVGSDGFVPPPVRKSADRNWNSMCKLTVSPVEFLMMVLKMRRKGMEFKRTHLGRVLAGDALLPQEFEHAS